MVPVAWVDCRNRKLIRVLSFVVPVYCSSRSLRLVRPTKVPPIARPSLLPPAGLVHAIRHSEHRSYVRKRIHDTGTEQAGATTIRPEARPAAHVRQRLHALHVQLTLRLRRQELPEGRAPLRPHLLGHQPRLRRRLSALAAARLPQAHATVEQMGHRHPRVHPAEHHRRTPKHPRQEQPARLYRCPAPAPGDGKRGQQGGAQLEPCPVRAGRLSGRPLGCRQSAHESHRSNVPQPRRHEEHPRGDPANDRRTAARRPRGPATHALHGSCHPGDAAIVFVADRAARRHARNVGCR